VKNDYEKHNCASLEAKLNIINRLKKGESQSSLASECGIGKSRTLKRTKKRLDNLPQQWEV